MGLNTPEPVEILIPTELIPTCIGKDFWQLVSSSVGSNYGTVFIERAFEAQPLFLKARKQMIPKLSDLYAFDALADNADRNEKKPNCLLDEADNLWLIDHELAFAFIHHLFGTPPDPVRPSTDILRTHLAFPFLTNKWWSLTNFVQNWNCCQPIFGICFTRRCLPFGKIRTRMSSSKKSNDISTF